MDKDRSVSIDWMVEKNESCLLRTSVFSNKYVTMSFTEILNFEGILDVAKKEKNHKTSLSKSTREGAGIRGRWIFGWPRGHGSRQSSEVSVR